MAVQKSTRGGAVQVPVSPADVRGDTHAKRSAFIQAAIDEHFLGQPVTGTGSAPQFFNIPQAGLLRRIRLHITGAVTPTLAGGTAAWTKDGLYKIINRVYFRDIGNATRFDCSGLALYAVSAAKTNSGHDPGFTTVTTSESSSIYSQPLLTTDGAKNFDFWLDLPFVYSQFDLRGLCNLNSPGRQSEMYIQLANAMTGDDTYPIAVTGAAAVALTDITVTPEIWTYTVTKVEGQGVILPMIDMSIVHEVVEAKDNIIVGQDTFHLFAPGRSIQRAMQYLVQNGSQTLGTINKDTGNTSAGAARVRLKYDNRNTPIDIRLSDFLRNSRDMTERDFNFVYHNFAVRPWDSVLTPQLQLGFLMNSDASSSGTSFLATIQENLYSTTSVPSQGAAG